MLESTAFTFNHIDSKDMGVFMINGGSGLYQESFLPSRKILETNVYGRKSRYFKGVEEEPLSFTLSFFIEGWRDRNNLRQIARWFYQPYYKPIWFESNPEHVYYIMFEGSPELIHNGCQDGYVTIPVRCNSPYSFSLPRVITESVITSKTITLLNDGDITIRPKLKITQYSTEDIKIKNEENGQEFILKAWDSQTAKGVQIGEVVEVDCANESIVSSFEETEQKYLYDDHNDVWLDFNMGEATFTMTGSFDIEITLEFAYLQQDRPIFF